MTYTSLITFRVAPGRSADFEAAFHRTGMLTRPRAVNGFLDAHLHRSLDDPDTYIVVGHWDTIDAYRDWQQRSAEHVPGLTELVDTLVDLQPGQLYQPTAPAPGEGPEPHSKTNALSL